MNKKRILSIVLAGIMSMGIFVGCGKSEEGSKGDTSQTTTKVDVVKESAFETVPENKLVPKYVKDAMANDESIIKDFSTFFDYYILEKQVDGHEELVKKYNLPKLEDTEHVRDLQKANPEFYNFAVTHVLAAGQKELETAKYAKSLNSMAQDYIANTLMGEDVEVKMAKEFKELNPQKQVKKYLKENKIEIENIIYPQEYENFHMGKGVNIMSLKFIIEGKQDGKSFSKEKVYDFYFIASEDIRNGADWRKENNCEIIAVTDTINEDPEKFLEITK